jgi:hypothetical protein
MATSGGSWEGQVWEVWDSWEGAKDVKIAGTTQDALARMVMSRMAIEGEVLHEASS